MSSILRANCAHVQSEHASAFCGFPYYSSSKIKKVHPIIWIFRGNFWKMNRLVRKNQRADEFALTPEILARVARQKAAKDLMAKEKEAKMRAKEDEFRAKQVQRRAKEDEKRRKSTEAENKKLAKENEKERRESLRREVFRDISKEVTNQDIREMSAQYDLMREMSDCGVKKSKPLQGNDLIM